MISHLRRLIYVHIPKCAGTTLEAWLAAKFPGASYMENPDAGIPFRLREENFAKIMQMYPSYYTFTFVRSPYRRFLSLWNHSLHPEAGSESYWERQPIDSAHDFAAILLRGDTGTLSRFDRFHWKPQSLYLPFDGCLFSHPVPKGYDFVGRLEHFDSDLNCLCKILGVSLGKTARLRVSGAKWKQQIDESLYSLISELYHDDISLLATMFPDDYGPEAESWKSFRDFHGLI